MMQEGTQGDLHVVDIGRQIFSLLLIDGVVLSPQGPIILGRTIGLDEKLNHHTSGQIGVLLSVDTDQSGGRGSQALHVSLAFHYVCTRPFFHYSPSMLLPRVYPVLSRGHR
ncbi:hypothetical protein FKM82_030281 [Ascaphus truei]